MSLKDIWFWLNKSGSYDDFAEDFSATRQKPWPEFAIVQDLVQSGDRILDIGCGNGRVKSLLGDDRQYFAIDASAKLIKLAKENHQKGIFQKASMTDLPFASHYFDLALMIASFHHLKNNQARLKALREAFRILRPGGKIMITVWNFAQERFKEARQEAKQRSQKFFWWTDCDLVITFGKQKIKRYYYMFSEKELEDYLKKCGFVNIIFHSNEKNIVLVAEKPLRSYLDDLPFDAVNFDQAKAKMHIMSDGEEQKILTTPNPEIMLEASKNIEFKNFLQSADLSVADGVGILWACNYLYYQKKTVIISLLKFLFSDKKSVCLPERIAGSELFKQFCQENHNSKIFLLGGALGAAKKCQSIFGQNIVGYFDGPVNDNMNKKIIQLIQDSEANVLFVALGVPKQELWIKNNMKNLPTVKLLAGLGGSFDFVAGLQKRAPRFFQKLGIEWLWRLFLEPKKRLGRIWQATIIFPKYIRQIAKKDIFLFMLTSYCSIYFDLAFSA